MTPPVMARDASSVAIACPPGKIAGLDGVGCTTKTAEIERELAIRRGKSVAPDISTSEVGREAMTRLNGEDNQPSAIVDKARQNQQNTSTPRPERIEIAQNEFQDFIFNTTGKALPIFGSSLFGEVPSVFAPVQNIPVTPDYVLGPGDELLIRVWGAIDVDVRRFIDRNGQINIPKVGTFSMAGIRIGEAESYLQTKIGRVFRNFELNVTIGQLRSVQIFVVGHARQPGTYTLPSLSTLVNALFASGGPSANGSMRRIQLKRAGKLVTELDLYDFLARGDRTGDERLQSGDVVIIPSVGSRVAVTGAFAIPAVYELKQTRAILSDVLELGGGVGVTTSVAKATRERIDKARTSPRVIEEITLGERGANVEIQDGDIITLLPISPRFDNAVTLKGNVANPMRYPWKKGMRISDLLPDKENLIPLSYWKKQNEGVGSSRLLRREVNWDYATIQRLQPNQLTTRLISFRLDMAINGNASENLELFPGDIVTIYSPDEIPPKTEQSVTIVGSLVGGNSRFVWRPGMRIKDLIPSTDWLIDKYDYWTNLKSDGHKTDINWGHANIRRQVVSDLSVTTIPFDLGSAVLQGDSINNLLLQSGDEVLIYSKSEISISPSKQARYIRLEGEVAAPGVYLAKPGETLRQLVFRTGGVTSDAHVHAAEFVRESTRILQQARLNESADQYERAISQAASQNTRNVLSVEDAAGQSASLHAQKELLTRMRAIKATGRVVLEVPVDAAGLVGIPDIALEDGDRFFVPGYISSVNVMGSVYNSNSYVYRPGRSVSDYLALAGGVTSDGDDDELYVVHANGSVTSKRQSGWLLSALSGRIVEPGDTIIAPVKIERTNRWTKELKDWTQILYQFGLGVAAIKTLRQ